MADQLDDRTSQSSLSKIRPTVKRSSGPLEKESPRIKLKTFSQEPARQVKQGSHRHYKLFHDNADSSKLFHASRAGQMDVLAQLDENALLHQDKAGNTALHHGARSNQVTTVKMFLDLGAKINVKNAQGFTPIHLAARFNCIDVVKHLLGRGADASIANDDGTTPLHSASRRGYEAIVRAFAETSHGTVNTPDVSDTTPLHSACANGHGPVCHLLLVHGADITATTTELNTPLHLAVLSGKVGIIEDLIKAASKRLRSPGDYICKRDLDGTSSLELACYRGYEDIAELLLSNGADPSSITAEGIYLPPLHVAAKYGYMKVVDFLVCRGSHVDIRNNELKTPLHRAAAFNQLKVISYLLDKGASTDAKDSHDQTPFLEAVRFGSKEAAELLLNRGADLHAVDFTLKTSVHLAVTYGHAYLDLLVMLLERDDGKLVQMTDEDLRTPVHFAAENGDKEILEILLVQGFAPDSADVDEKIPLHVAAENDAWECAVLLGQASCQSLNRKNEQGRAALHLAAAKGHSKTCSVLFHLGASAMLRDIARSTPLHLAVTAGSLSTVMNFLDPRQPNTIEAKDKRGNTALLLACQYGHVDIVQALLDHGADVTARNETKQTCLDVSIEWWMEAVARTLVQHERWREVMTNTDVAGRSPMEKLIKQLPQVASIALDRCITRSNLPLSNPDLAITFDFQFLDPGPDAENSEDGSYFGPSVMAEKERESLLNHSLTKELLHWKWFAMGKFPFYLDFLSFQCFVVLFSVFIITEREKVSMYGRDQANPSFASVITERRSFAISAPFVLFVFVIVQQLKTLFKLVLLRLSFLLQWSTLVEITLYFSTLMFLLPYITWDPDLYADSITQWRAAIIAVFFTYLNDVLYIRRLRTFGIYVTMYFYVFVTFLKVMSTFIIFIIGFTMLYYVLLKEQDDFSTFGYSFVKTTVMMIGEMDYSNILTDNVVNDKTVDGTDLPYVPMPNITYVIFYIFCFGMPIILMNLLVGLAVGDIDSIQKSASLRNLIDEVNQIAVTERGLPKFIQRKAYRKSLTLRPNQMSRFEKLVYFGTDVINLQSHLESLLTLDSQESQAPKKAQEEGKTGNQSHSERHQEQLASLQTTVQAQGRLLRAMAEKLEVNLERGNNETVHL